MAGKKKSVEMRLPEPFTIKSIGEAYDSFAQALGEERDLVLDCGEVETFDFPALQLLYSLKRSCHERDLAFRLDNISDDLMEKIGLCGFQKYLLEEAGA